MRVSLDSLGLLDSFKFSVPLYRFQLILSTTPGAQNMFYKVFSSAELRDSVVVVHYTSLAIV